MYRIDLSTEEKKEAFISMLSFRLGNITEACRFVGISRQTYYDWLQDDLDFARQVSEIHEEVKDFYESQGAKLAGVLDGAQIRYWLSHRAKDRGYGSTPQRPSLPAININQQFNLGLPPPPKNLAEWEAQVIEAREQRLLTEGRETNVIETDSQLKTDCQLESEQVIETDSQQGNNTIETDSQLETNSELESTSLNEEGKAKDG